MDWFKTMTTNEYIRGVKRRDWPRFRGKLWQRNYHDRIIHDGADLKRVQKYVRDNPWRWSMDVENPQRDAS